MRTMTSRFKKSPTLGGDGDERPFEGGYELVQEAGKSVCSQAIFREIPCCSILILLLLMILKVLSKP